MSKRTSAYKHGQPGREFEEERPEDPADTPKKATAAQLAGRKIKNLKPRRAAGATSSGLTAFGLNPPSANTFDFGPDPNASSNGSNPFAQSAPAPRNSGTPFTMSQPAQSNAPAQPPRHSGIPFTMSQPGQNSATSGNAFTFGGNSTGSFPPAQSLTPNAFGNSANSSFPSAKSFGQISAFNAKPDLDFGNTTTNFGASTPTNGFTFGASQNNAASAPASNGFSFLGAANKQPSTPSGSMFGNNNNNNASTSAQSGGIFSTSATPQNSLFGGFGQNNNAATSSSTPNPFGSPNNTASNASPFQFGANTQPTTTAQESASIPQTLFGGISSPAQTTSTSETPKPLFGTLSGAQQNNVSSEAQTPLLGSSFNAASTAPANPFGSNTATTGGSSLFGTFGAQSNGFNPQTTSTQNQTATTPALSNPPFTFGPTVTSNSLFGNFGATTQAGPQSTGARPEDLFAALRTPEPVPGPQAISLTTSANKIKKPEDNTANETAVPNAADEPTHNDQTVQNPFTPQSSFTPAPAPEQQPTTATPSNDPFKASKPATFGSTSTSIAATFTPAPTLKPAPSESATTSTAPTFTPAPASKPAASSSKETSKDTPVSTIPRVHVPPEWTANMTSTNDLRECTRALVALNEFYRGRLAQLSPTADWSALSKWHLAQSSELKKKIDQLRKQEAAAKGITGEETILSTKRKNDEQGPVESPFKKARSGEAPATPQSKASALPSTTPKTNPPLTSFNIFASASSQQSTPGTNNFSKSATQQSAPATEPANAGGFKPILGPSSACGNPSGGFKPSFGASSATDKPSGGGFFSQFGGKTKEQLRKERLQQALDKDYDSPTESEEEEGNYETKEQFIARWNKAEDERQAALDVAANSSTLKFVPTATNKKTDIPTLKFTNASSNEPSASQSLASGTSTPGFFGSRVGSPAPSTEGARSVFDTPAGTQTPNNNNPFGHLSASSSQRQDDSDDDADDEAAPRSSNGVGSHKRKMSDAEGSESSETLEETMRRKKHATEKPSLFSRMSYGNSNDDQDASETPKQLSLTDRITRENSEAAPESVDENTAPPMLNATNSKLFNIGGSQTPAPKKAFQFDFAAAAAKSAPPKQSTLAGDQTFKVGDPIKFGSSTSTPSQFNFTPATPTAPASAASTTPAKPATNPFAFLGAAAHSAANSAVSSRAATPATDAEASGTDSAAINEEEGKNFVDNEDKSLLSDAERDEFNVLFEFPQTIARKIVKKEGGAPAWEKVATGRLWILQNKKDESIIIRLRIKSGAIKVNHRLVSGVPASLTGSSNQQVRTTAPVVKDGSTGFEPLVFAFNGSDVNEKQELAKRFMTVYNQHV